MSYQLACPECEFSFQVAGPVLDEVVVCPDCALNLKIVSIDNAAKAAIAKLTETNHQDWGQ